MTIKLKNPFNLPVLLSALLFVALTWYWPRLMPGTQILRWFFALGAIVLFALSFATANMSGWLLRKPLLLAGYAGATLARVWPATFALVAVLGGALWFGGARTDGVEGDTESVAPSAPGAPVVVPTAALLEFGNAEVFGKEGAAPGEFREPHGLAIGKDGTLYVADTLNKRVQVFNAAGKPVRQLTQGKEPFKQPFDLVLASNGDLFVLDSERATIERFSPAGQLLASFGSNLGFYFPRGLAIDPQDNLFVADTGGSKVVKLSPTGENLLVFGVRGKERGEFTEPTGVAVAADGTVFAVDPSNRKLLAFKADGTFIRDVAIEQAGSVNAPKLAIEPGGTILMSVPEPHLIRRYSAALRPLGEFGGSGAEPGRFRLPTYVLRNGNDLWVADTLNHRVQKIALK